MVVRDVDSTLLYLGGWRDLRWGGGALLACRCGRLDLRCGRGSYRSPTVQYKRKLSR
jgi:hypothetical protein